MFVPRHPTVWAMAGSLLLAPGGLAAAQTPAPDAASQTEESRPEKSSTQGNGAQTPAPTQEAPDGHVPYTPPPEEAAQLPQCLWWIMKKPVRKLMALRGISGMKCP